MKGSYLFGYESEGHLAWQIRFEKTSDPKTLLFPALLGEGTRRTLTPKQKRIGTCVKCSPLIVIVAGECYE
jgi:hypothetical protein